jgi:hypothetical protein
MSSMTEKVEWSIGNRLLAMNTSPGGREERGEREHDRQDGGDERAEREQQDQDVTGMGRISAWEKSLPAESLAALPKLAVPNSSTRNPWWDFCTPATARSTGATRSIVCIMSPRTLNCTSVEWPSRDTSIAPPRVSGERTFEVHACPLTASTVACAVSRKCGSPTV